jgi:hypothetical protein
MAETNLTVQDAYLALFKFLESFWIRDGRPDDSLAKLLSWAQPVAAAKGCPTDPAMWGDWLSAIQQVSTKDNGAGT